MPKLRLDGAEDYTIILTYHLTRGTLVHSINSSIEESRILRHDILLNSIFDEEKPEGLLPPSAMHCGGGQSNSNITLLIEIFFFVLFHFHFNEWTLPSFNLTVINGEG